MFYGWDNTATSSTMINWCDMKVEKVKKEEEKEPQVFLFDPKNIVIDE